MTVVRAYMWRGCRTSDLFYAHNIMAGNSRTFDLILGCKTRNEFDA